MTRTRKITAAIFATIGILLTGSVLYYWHEQGCGWSSLAAALVFYGSCASALWLVADQTIKEATR